MFSDDLVIGGIKAQSNRLKDLLEQIEGDEKWKTHQDFYFLRLKDIEKALRKIRKQDFNCIAAF